MNENVIKFRKPEPPKQKKPLSPGSRKLLVIAAVILFFAGAWAYFQYLA